MYDYPDMELFYQDGTWRDYLIMVSSEDEDEEEPVILTNEDVEEGSFEYIDSIMSSESLTFQSCISAYVKFITFQTARWINKVLTIYEIINGDVDNPIPLGSFIVTSDNLTSDRKTREIIAYDYFYEIINSDVTDWYNSLDFPISVKDFRDSFFEEFSLEQEEIELVNDDIMLPQQINEGDTINGATIVKSLAEFNGVFIHLSNLAIVRYISIDRGNIYDTGLCPPFYPSDETFPGVKYDGEYYDIYKNYYKEDSIVYANYSTLEPDGIQIRNENNQIAYQTNEAAENPYTLINNILCYYLSDGQYTVVADRLLEKFRYLSYVPFTGEFMGNPCLQTGDRIRIFTQDGNEIVTYIFDKHTVGMLVPFDTVNSKGQYYLARYNLSSQSKTAAKVKNLEQRVGNMEKSGSGPLQIRSVLKLPDNPELNVLYLIQGVITMTPASDSET